MAGMPPLAHSDPVVAEEAALIGLTLEELFSLKGVPQSVYAIRGAEAWQDDAALVYADCDCYILVDRVWQVSVKATLGIKTGDTRTAVSTMLGESRQDFEMCILFQLPSKVWPLTLRVNFDKAGKVQTIFIYRPDV
jgi:hypothetical protein